MAAVKKARPMRIREGDHVIVISGKDRGKTGRVLHTNPEKRTVFVEGAGIVKKHSRPRSVKETQRGGQVGGIVEQEGPIPVSNVMILDPQDNKPTRVGVVRENGKRIRVAKRTGNHID